MIMHTVLKKAFLLSLLMTVAVPHAQVISFPELTAERCVLGGVFATLALNIYMVLKNAQRDAANTDLEVALRDNCVYLIARVEVLEDKINLLCENVAAEGRVSEEMCHYRKALVDELTTLYRVIKDSKEYIDSRLIATSELYGDALSKIHERFDFIDMRIRTIANALGNIPECATRPVWCEVRVHNQSDDAKQIE